MKKKRLKKRDEKVADDFYNVLSRSVIIKKWGVHGEGADVLAAPVPWQPPELGCQMSYADERW